MHSSGFRISAHSLTRLEARFIISSSSHFPAINRSAKAWKYIKKTIRSDQIQPQNKKRLAIFELKWDDYELWRTLCQND